MAKIHVIDGKQYVEVERLAEVGDKIYADWSDKIYTVESVDGTFAVVERRASRIRGFYHGTYATLEPVADTRQAVEFTTDDVKYAPEKVLDLLANLARRVTSLEQQLASTQENVVRQAEELANLRYTAEERLEMLTDDVVLLDERTQPLTRESIRVFIGGGTQ